jgi:hypothetical protein
MLEAVIRGKVSREIEYMEDVLTSAVFGGFRYAQPQDAVFPFLARCRRTSGEAPLAFLATVVSGTVEYEFWRWWPDRSGFRGCEPDVVLDITAGAKHMLVLVEAKLCSGKSSVASEIEEAYEPPNDQLAREWCQLVLRAADINAEPLLVYLTADTCAPVSDIEDSRKEHARNSLAARVAPPDIAWLSWRHLAAVLEGARERALVDISRFITRLGLRPYCLHPMAPAAEGRWEFSAPGSEFGWRDTRCPSPAQTASRWRFTA